ncbi:MAG: ankyrin repeat domain-containing protein [Thermoanaerobaculia bacterium]|nr:ankyrin repeat domain-containing protein [Thermoanaerobaculia bacterium]
MSEETAPKEPEIIVAARRGDLGRVRQLVEDGADLNAPTATGETALTAALTAGHDAVVRLLRSVGARGAGPALARAAERDDLDEVARLLATGEPVDAAAVDRSGRRFIPLHRAAFRGHSRIVRALLDAGASHSARVGGGPPPWDRSALHLAAAAGHLEVIELLLDAGADATALDLDAYGNRRTAAELARSAGHETLASTLERVAGPGPPAPEPDGPASSLEGTIGRYASRRGLYLDEGVQTPALVLLHAEVDEVAKALQHLEGARTWWRDVYGETAELTRRSFAVLRLAGHRWTLVSSLVAAGPHVEEHDAVRLGLALDTPALRTAASSDGETGASYAYFHGEACLERMVWRQGHELDYESHLQDLTADNIADPRTRADVFLAELDAWAPHHLGPLGRPGEDLRLDLGLEPDDVERLDFVAVW